MHQHWHQAPTIEMSVRSRGGFTATKRPPTSWTQCHAYMERKVRFCRCEKLAGTDYCGAHQPESQDQSQQRVPCPHDPSHTVFLSRLHQHIKKCPKLRELRSQKAQRYYCQDCNIGGSGAIEESTDSTAYHSTMDLEWAQQVALHVIATHQKLFAVPTDDPRNVTLQEIQEAIPMMDLGKDEMEVGLEQAVAALRIKSGGVRHLNQQASFIGHLRRVGALDSLHKRHKLELPTLTGQDQQERRTILEVGAGRGITGLLVAGVSAASRPTKLVMVEREAPRGRARPGATKSDEIPYQMNIASLECQRIKCDLAHVKLDHALDDRTSDIVVVAKHLCGCGTDLALKSLIPVTKKVSYVIMSTCCHGACNWQDYVGRDFIQKVMTMDDGLSSFGAKEFKLLMSWSAGTVKAVDPNKKKPESNPSSTEEVEHREALSTAGNISLEFGVTKIVESIGLVCGVHGLGRACQRIIDFGRLQFIKKALSFGDNCELLYYVPDSITPQNALLIAHR